MSGEANSFAYLTQRLYVAVQCQWGNAASMLGTMKVFFFGISFVNCIVLLCGYTMDVQYVVNWLINACTCKLVPADVYARTRYTCTVRTYLLIMYLPNI